MSFASRPSPARVTRAAATKLPRVLLLALLAVYICTGLTGHDPWPDDGSAFGAMWTIAGPAQSPPDARTGAAGQGQSLAWWFPSSAGAQEPSGGPLPIWLGAASIRLVGRLVDVAHRGSLADQGDPRDPGDPDIAPDPAAAGYASFASRMPQLAWFIIAVAALWAGTYRLARRDEAQPVVLAFGGHADARDYARMLADVAALLFVGTIGVVLRWHEATIDGATVAFGALALYGTALALDSAAAAGIVCGLAAGGLGLSDGVLPAMGLMLGNIMALTLAGRGGAGRGRSLGAIGSIGSTGIIGVAGSFGGFGGPGGPGGPGGARVPRAWIAAVLATLVAAVILAAWPVLASWRHPQAASAYFFAGLARWGPQLAIARGADLAWLMRNAGWYLWPLWPLAAWAIYAWRAVRGAAHIARPAWLAASILAVGLLCAPVGELALAPLVAPVAALAAFGGTTLRRAADNMMDWLAVALYSLAALFVWAYFVAMATGSPPRMAASIAHLAPGFRAMPQAGVVIGAAVASAAWIGLVAWRAARQSHALWRGPLLAAAGTTLLWSIMVALFMPAFDYTQSHRALAREIALQVPWLRGGGNDRVSASSSAGNCLQAHRIPPPVRALIAFHGGLRFGRGDDGEACSLALQRISGTTALDEDPPPGRPGTWALTWVGHRPARPAETWLLWRRQTG